MWSLPHNVLVGETRALGLPTPLAWARGPLYLQQLEHRSPAFDFGVAPDRFCQTGWSVLSFAWKFSGLTVWILCLKVLHSSCEFLVCLGLRFHLRISS